MNLPSMLIAEDDFVIREGLLRSLLEPHFSIVASVDDGLDAVSAAAEHKPEIVLLDISLPGLEGLAAARRILASNPACKVLLVSNYIDRKYADAARRMGASGYVLKSRASRELVSAIETAQTGTFYQSEF